MMREIVAQRRRGNHGVTEDFALSSPSPAIDHVVVSRCARRAHREELTSRNVEALIVGSAGTWLAQGMATLLIAVFGGDGAETGEVGAD